MGFSTTVQQVGLMFAFIAMGLLAAKRLWIDDKAVSGMTNILIYLVTPGVILNAFNRPFSRSRLAEFGIAAVVIVGVFFVMIAIAWALFARVRDADKRRDLRFATIYPNGGYLGLPLVQALLGSDGVFFAILFVVWFNIFVWTQGWSMFSTTPGGRIKQLFSNPALPTVAIGVVIFLTSLRLPNVVATGLGYLATMNAPLSMFVIGASLAAIKWRTFAADIWVWVGTAVRTVVVPLVMVLVLWVVPLPHEAKISILIQAACPVAAFMVMFSIMHKTNTDFATRLVCLSTLVSIVTLPATLTLASALW